MKWLTNLHESKLDQAWLADKIIGRPKATKWHTIEALEGMGMVGVYKRDDKP